MKILLTDIYYRKSFDIINILKRHYSANSFIYTVSTANSFNSVKANLIYGAKKLHLLRMNEGFNEDLVKISNAFDEKIVYIPIEESTTLNFIKFLDDKSYSHNYRYMLPNLSTFLLSRNKETLNVFSENNEIPCPTFISEQTFKSRAFSFPIIIKPKHGSGAKGIIYIENEVDLGGIAIDFNDSFLQERLPNPKEVEAGFFLCNKGEVTSFYGHKRIRTYPEVGGVTVYSKCNDSPELQKLGKTIIKKLNWSGLLMIEFLFDGRDNTYKLIEINPRLWGSIMLSEFCGANILKNYVELSLGESVKDNEINTQTFIRWIFPYDIIYWLKNMSNPFKFFNIRKDTCYINFTYTSFFKSLFFVSLTYFNFKKIGNLFKNG